MSSEKKFLAVQRPAAALKAEDARVVAVGYANGRHCSCGQPLADYLVLEVLGQRLTVTPDDLARAGRCANCYLREFLPRVIRCADCGGPILPGMTVATPIVDARDAGKDWITTLTYGPHRMTVVCLCGEGALFQAGRWTGELIEVNEFAVN